MKINVHFGRYLFQPISLPQPPFTTFSSQFIFSNLCRTKSYTDGSKLFLLTGFYSKFEMAEQKILSIHIFGIMTARCECSHHSRITVGVSARFSQKFILSRTILYRLLFAIDDVKGIRNPFFLERFSPQEKCIASSENMVALLVFRSAFFCITFSRWARDWG